MNLTEEETKKYFAMANAIRFLSVDAVENAKIAVYKGVGHCVGHAATAKTLKYILETHKIENEVFYYGSTMDFADEVGFAHHDDAKKIVEECFEMIRCETVAKELV